MYTTTGERLARVVADRSEFTARPATGGMEETGQISWRRDASTSRTLRLLWTVGAGTFLAAIALVAISRVFALAGETGGTSPVAPLTPAQLVIIAALLAGAVTILAIALADRRGHRVAYVGDALEDADRSLDAAVGAVLMGAVIVALARGAGAHGEMLAAATIPLALVAVAASVFLRSAGALDVEEGVLYLLDPDDAVDLGDLEAVSARYVGNTAVVTLRYHQPDNQYVPGPRRLVLPPGVARDLEAIVGTN